METAGTTLVAVVRRGRILPSPLLTAAVIFRKFLFGAVLGLEDDDLAAPMWIEIREKSTNTYELAVSVGRSVSTAQAMLGTIRDDLGSMTRKEFFEKWGTGYS